MVSVVVLRLGHRPERDQRVTTHVGLTARALGAEGMLLAAKDKGIVESIGDVVSRWGGQFFVQDGVSWRKVIHEWKRDGGSVAHLTMYGINLPDCEGEIREKEKILVVVGAEKVPGEVFGLADFNIAVTSQPHSEVAGLALLLDRIYSGRELTRTFPGAAITVIPSACGKRTQERQGLVRMGRE